MKSPPFEYAAASTVRDVCDLLAQNAAETDAEVKVIAGGQSLVPLMNFRLARPRRLVDINGVSELSYVDVADRRVEFGALYRHREVELNAEVMAAAGAIRDAVPLIGHVAIRNRGTVAGSLAHGDPLAEWCVLALLFECSVEAVGHRGSRHISGRDLLTGFLETDLAPDEFIRSVSFDLGPREAGSSFVELARRHGDFAIVSVGALLKVDSEALAEVRVVLSGLKALPYRLTRLENWLLGKAPTDEVFATAAALALEGEVASTSDLHGSAAYRRHASGVLIRRALAKAAERAESLDRG
jgi:aerobic carbon-monoxide dehydrogenase medium subunit